MAEADLLRNFVLSFFPSGSERSRIFREIVSHKLEHTQTERERDVGRYPLAAGRVHKT